MRATAPDTDLPVSVHGVLRLDTPSGREMALHAEGRVLRLDVPGWSAFRDLMPRSAASRSGHIRNLSRALFAADLTLRLETGGRGFLEIGRGVRANWLSRLLRIAPARLRLVALASLLGR